MKTITINFSDTINGGKIISFNYSKSLNELCGSWSATAYGGTFTAGNSISFNDVMRNGIISKAYKDSTNVWHVEGYDAGVRLMRTIPDIADIPPGDADKVINYLAGYCGVDTNANGSSSADYNARSLISGSTCAEAILELAMLSGKIAYINKNGNLQVRAPAGQSSLKFENALDDSGSDFDLDGYATYVTVNLTSRKLNQEEDDETGSGSTEHFTGETPANRTNEVRYSGSFNNGRYEITMLEPFHVPVYEETVITENGVKITTENTHEYDYEYKKVWRDNQEYALFAFIETGYELTKTTEGEYTTQKGDRLSFTETTTETMERDIFGPIDAVGVAKDWQGSLGMVMSETITRTTEREGGKAPTADMPPYSPPFDCEITRNYKRGLRGQSLVCKEIEKRYEARQVGTISPVKLNGELIPHFMLDSNLAIQTHSTPEWVEVDTYRTYFEQYNNKGECMVSTRSEYCDNGSKWLSEHALSETGDEDLDEYQKAYAQFSQDSQGIEVAVGQSVLSTAWQFLELPGKVKTTLKDSEDGVNLGDVEKWYDNGKYANSAVCPHYNASGEYCNIYALNKTASGGDDDADCSYDSGTAWNWIYCARAEEALKRVREQENKELVVAVTGTAGASGSHTVGYKRDIYIDEELTQEDAQSIADTLAANILRVKKTKGIRRTVTVPYDNSYEINGNIVAISHDWENLTTAITYRDNGDIPDFLVSQSVSGIAAFVSARDTSRLNSPKYGVITEITVDNTTKVTTYTVQIGNNVVPCSSKLKNLDVGDTVLVSFPAGNKLRGQVISRL